MTTTPPIPFPADLARYVLPEALDALDTTEIGCAYRLIRRAWGQERPCSLQNADSSLAMVAGVTDELWARVKPRLWLALGASMDQSATRVVFGYALRAQQNLAGEAAADAQRRRERTAAATAAAAASRRGASVTDPSRIRDGSVTDGFSTVAPTLRSSGSETPPLQRSTNQRQILSAQSGRSFDPEQRQSAEDVLAVVGDRAGAILNKRLATWRREKSLAMLQKAIAQWGRDGWTTCPMFKAAEIADKEHATPARIDYVIERASGIIAGYSALFPEARKSKRRPNPVGYILHTIGDSERSAGVPCLVPLIVEQRWAKAESDSVGMLRAQAALQARINAVRESVRQTNPSTPTSAVTS